MSYPLRLRNPPWILPSLFLRPRPKRRGQWFHTHDQPFHSLNSNTYFPRNPLTRFLFLPSLIRTCNIGLLTSNTTLSGSKPCHKFTSLVTLPLPSTILSTSLIASLPLQAAGIESFVSVPGPNMLVAIASVLRSYTIPLGITRTPVDTRNLDSHL